MIAFTSRLFLASAVLLGCSATLSAQQGGGTGDTGNGTGAAGGTSTIGAVTEAGAGGSLDPEAAFSTIDRGDTIGATGGTGTGFSAVSAANQGGGGGIGGFGGGGFGGGGFGGLGGLGGLFGGGFNNQGQNTRPAIRTRLRSAVLHEPHPPEVIQRRVGQRFRSAPQPAIRGVQVTMEGRRGVMTGVVESARHARMSELLLRLEPGVDVIDNRLEVASP